MTLLSLMSLEKLPLECPEQRVRVTRSLGLGLSGYKFFIWIIPLNTQKCIVSVSYIYCGQLNRFQIKNNKSYSVYAHRQKKKIHIH